MVHRMTERFAGYEVDFHEAAAAHIRFIIGRSHLATSVRLDARVLVPRKGCPSREISRWFLKAEGGVWLLRRSLKRFAFARESVANRAFDTPEIFKRTIYQGHVPGQNSVMIPVPRHRMRPEPADI